MGKKQKKPRRLGTGTMVFFLAVLFWLVASHPWLLLFPIAYWFCFIRPNRQEAVRRRPPPQTVASARAPRTMAVVPPLRTAVPAPRSNVVPRPVKAAPPDIIPKDREYNRHLARTWDEEFESLVRKREQVPPA